MLAAKAFETVHFIITGGTIDSFYDGAKDTVRPYPDSVIPRYMDSLKLYNRLEFTQLCMKDSRDLSKADLKSLVEIIRKSPHKKIIVTHGTYTMPDTARLLKMELNGTGKTIVLTGSLMPLAEFSFSDSGFNLGFAFSQVLSLPPGVYVCMSGRVFDADESAKDVSEGRFVSIFGEGNK